MNKRTPYPRAFRIATLGIALLGAVCVVRQPAFAQPCTGDCRGIGQVGISDLILAVNIVLGLAPLTECPALGLGPVGINHLVASVSNAICACQPCPPRPPTSTPRATPTITAIPTATASPTPEAIVSTWRESNFALPNSSCPRQVNQQIRQQLAGMTFDYTVSQIGERAELSDAEGDTVVGTIDDGGNLELRTVETGSQGACMVTLDVLQIVNLSRSPANARTELRFRTQSCPNMFNCLVVVTSRWTRTSPAVRVRRPVGQRASAIGSINAGLRDVVVNLHRP